MTEPVLQISNTGRIRVLTLNRPDRRNALSDELNSALREAILAADTDTSVSIVAITGNGSSFCAGADLKEARDRDQGGGFHGPLHRQERSLYEVMIDCQKPLLAAVNGPAVAGGFELALACDIRIVASTAHFAVPEARRGLGAHFASVVLPQMVPPGVAMEWLFTGRQISLQEAERWGLVNRIVPADKLMDEAMALAGEVALSAPISLQRMKATAIKTRGLPLHSAIRLEAGPNPYTSEDRKEGALAFLEKRAPVWKGR